MPFTLRPHRRVPMPCAVTYHAGLLLTLPLAYCLGFWLLITLLVLSSGPAYAEWVAVEKNIQVAPWRILLPSLNVSFRATSTVSIVIWMMFPEDWSHLARIIHERFYCNRGFAAATHLAACFTAPKRAGSPLGRLTSCSWMPPRLPAPRARLAGRLHDFVTNRHE